MNALVKIGTTALTAEDVEMFSAAWSNPRIFTRDTGAAVGIPPGSVHFYAKKLGFPARPRRSKFPSDIDTILKRDVGKVPLRVIADRYGVCISAVKKRAHALGLVAKVIRAESRPEVVARPVKVKKLPPRKSPNHNSSLFVTAPKQPRVFTAEIRGDVPVRRFEMGASATNYDSFLQAIGYIVHPTRNGAGFKVRQAGQRGAGKFHTRAQLIALLDQERMKRGLEPIVRVR